MGFTTAFHAKFTAHLTKQRVEVVNTVRHGKDFCYPKPVTTVLPIFKNNYFEFPDAIHYNQHFKLKI